MSEKEQSEKLNELRTELSKERATSEIGGMLKSPGRIREIRRSIARILTVKNSKAKKEVKEL